MIIEFTGCVKVSRDTLYYVVWHAENNTQKLDLHRKIFKLEKKITEDLIGFPVEGRSEMLSIFCQSFKNQSS